MFHGLSPRRAVGTTVIIARNRYDDDRIENNWKRRRITRWRRKPNVFDNPPPPADEESDAGR